MSGCWTLDVVATVRKATLDDVDAVRTVGHETWPGTYGGIRSQTFIATGLATWWSAERVSAGITDLATYVAEVAGEVIGCAMLDAVIAGLPPEAATLQLDHADGNDRAHAFYEAQGFRTAYSHGAAGEREVRMERRLR